MRGPPKLTRTGTLFPVRALFRSAWSELGCRHAQRHIVLAGAFAGPDPAAADLRARAIDPVVGMAFVALGTVGDDLDVGPDRQGTQLALEAVFVAGDISDGRHVRSPQTRPRTVRGDGQTVGMAGRSEEQTSELQSLMRISYAGFCLKKKK